MTAVTPPEQLLPRKRTHPPLQLFNDYHDQVEGDAIKDIPDARRKDSELGGSEDNLFKTGEYYDLLMDE